MSGKKFIDPNKVHKANEMVFTYLNEMSDLYPPREISSNRFSKRNDGIYFIY